jgi:hypothetical protein
MKKIIFTLIFILLNIAFLKAQAPFTTLVKEARFVEKVTNIDGKEVFKKVKKIDSTFVFNLLDIEKSALTENQKVETKKNDIDFFKNNSLSLTILNEGETRTSVSAQVIHYKLYVANPNEKNKYRINRYNIPLMLISKLSTSYDSINSSSSIDVLDYEAAPITLRIMPSWKKSFKTYSDVIYYGFYTDLRGLNLYNTQTNEYDMEFIGSAGIGITYQGDGSAGTYNKNGEYSPGRYSVSAILQGATGKKEVIGKLFDTDKDFVGSFQSYFIFKVAEKSHLNIKIGYQYFFDRTIAGTKSNFSIALGI